MKIALLTGGTSSEREIALQSAVNVEAALRVYFDVDVFDLPVDLDRFISVRSEYACAVPIFHGRGGEDGQIQGLLETLGVPYIFSSVGAHALGADKVVTKKIVAAHGIQTPQWNVLRKQDAYTFEDSVVVKPRDGGSSLGTFLVHDEAALAESLKHAFDHADHVLVEKLVSGREFTVGVVEKNGKIQVLPVIEIRSKNAFFDFESKYDAALVEEICPAPIDEVLAQRLQEVAHQAHVLIGARHMSRTDMIVDEQGSIWFLEINTIPGLTKNSLLPKSLDAAECQLSELLKEWVHQVL